MGEVVDMEEWRWLCGKHPARAAPDRPPQPLPRLTLAEIMGWRIPGADPHKAPQE